MYAKCGSIEDTQRMLNKMPSSDVVTWNVRVLRHVKWATAEGIGTISTNATGTCTAKLCYFCGGAECMCQHGSA